MCEHPRLATPPYENILSVQAVLPSKKEAAYMIVVRAAQWYLFRRAGCSGPNDGECRAGRTDQPKVSGSCRGHAYRGEEVCNSVCLREGMPGSEISVYGACADDSHFVHGCNKQCCLKGTENYLERQRRQPGTQSRAEKYATWVFLDRTTSGQNFCAKPTSQGGIYSRLPNVRYFLRGTPKKHVALPLSRERPSNRPSTKLIWMAPTQSFLLVQLNATLRIFDELLFQHRKQIQLSHS